MRLHSNLSLLDALNVLPSQFFPSSLFHLIFFSFSLYCHHKIQLNVLISQNVLPSQSLFFTFQLFSFSLYCNHKIQLNILPSQNILPSPHLQKIFKITKNVFSSFHTIDWTLNVLPSQNSLSPHHLIYLFISL